MAGLGHFRFLKSFVYNLKKNQENKSKILKLKYGIKYFFCKTNHFQKKKKKSAAPRMSY